MQIRLNWKDGNPITTQAQKKKEKYGKLDKAVMSIWECCELLNEYVDESDPDLDEPQIEHLLQTAEAIRRDYPNEDWLHLTALIHDLGKVLLHPAFGEEAQWSVVGDTFPLGCAFSESIVHPQFFKENPDTENPNFNTKLGIYTENCGLDKVTMSWGHDEYMYLVATENNTTLPPAGLFIIRFHSFYALHRAGDYTYLMNEEDREMLKWLHVFNKYDLYSKTKVRINLEEVKPYYLSLIKKVCHQKLPVCALFLFFFRHIYILKTHINKNVMFKLVYLPFSVLPRKAQMVMDELKEMKSIKLGLGIRNAWKQQSQE
ncbi:hypothetical protein RJ639_042413 [Escallonia herrerae]|uniref:Inositol oxygenase n=1 Tax=Escallonia herrerae TaxID=1293975 RepID=A0AA89B2Q8_9ASTE|nr:hypothetical protein RJ639_042413 [Escallonia herrerae]